MKVTSVRYLDAKFHHPSPKIKKIPQNTNGWLAIPALAGLLVLTETSVMSIDIILFTVHTIVWHWSVTVYAPAATAYRFHLVCFVILLFTLLSVPCQHWLGQRVSCAGHRPAWVIGQRWRPSARMLSVWTSPFLCQDWRVHFPCKNGILHRARKFTIQMQLWRLTAQVLSLKSLSAKCIGDTSLLVYYIMCTP